MAHVSGYTFTTSSSSLNNGRRKSTGSFQVFNDNTKHNYVMHDGDNKLIQKIQKEMSMHEPRFMDMGMGMNMGTVASADRIVDIIEKTRRRRRQQQKRRLSSTTRSGSRRKNPVQQKKKKEK